MPHFAHLRLNPIPLMKNTLCLLVAIGTLLLTTIGFAQESSMVVKNARILDSQVVDLGNRKITYNRIEAPALKPAPTPEAAPVAAAKEYVPTAEELAEIRHWESLRYEYLGGSATIFDGIGTEFRLWTPEGEAVALSSIDFNFLQCLWDLEREGVYYNVFFFASGYSPEEFAEARKSEPEWAAQFGEFPKEAAGMSRFTVVSAPKGEAGEKAIQALEDIHSYFDENRKQLRAAYEESEKARIAQEEWVKAHPPTPQDTIIHFFPIRSSTHPVKTSVQVEEARK